MSNNERKKGIIALILSSGKVSSSYSLTRADAEEIFELITNESELSSKMNKCLDFLQAQFISHPAIISQLHELISNGFDKLLNLGIPVIRNYAMKRLIEMFFKVDSNYEIFFEVFFNMVQSDSFTIEGEDAHNPYKTNFYYQYAIKKDTDFSKIFFVYNYIDKNKTQEKLELIIEKLFKKYGDTFLNFILVLMCYKIKNNNKNPDIEKEKKIFSIFYSKNFTLTFDSVKPLLDFIFNAEVQMSNRKTFADSIFRLSSSLGIKVFVDILNFISRDPEFLTNYLKQCDPNVVKDNLSHFYLFLDFSKDHSLEKTEIEPINETQKFELFSNIIKTFEILAKLTSDFNVIYLKIQLMMMKYFYPYPPNVKHEKHDLFFMRVESYAGLKKEMKNYEKSNKSVTSFMNNFTKNLLEKSFTYFNWFHLIFKNFSLFDSFKALNGLLLENFKQKPEYLKVLVRLPNEFNQLNHEAWKKILHIYLFKDIYNNLKTEEIYNLLRNLKLIFYHEISSEIPIDTTNRIFNSLTYDHNEIIHFFKDQFGILSSYFFTQDVSPSGDLMDLEDKYESFMENDIKNSAGSDSNMEIKAEILNIFSLLVNSYKKTERVQPTIIKFTLDLVDIVCLNPQAKISIQIQNSISLIIKLYLELLPHASMEVEDGKSNQIYTNPIYILFTSIIKHLIIKILKHSDTEKMEMYYSYYTSLVNTLKALNSDPNKRILTDIKHSVVYHIKQMIYKSADSQNFRNPLIIRSMNGINDISPSIISNKHIIDLLEILSREEQVNFYGFYSRFFSISIKEKDHTNCIKIIKLLIQIETFPNNFLDLVQILQNPSAPQKNKENILKFLNNYMNEIKSINENPERLNSEIIKFKYLIYDNISYITN